MNNEWIIARCPVTIKMSVESADIGLNMNVLEFHYVILEHFRYFVI